MHSLYRSQPKNHQFIFEEIESFKDCFDAGLASSIQAR